MNKQNDKIMMNRKEVLDVLLDEIIRRKKSNNKVQNKQIVKYVQGVMIKY